MTTFAVEVVGTSLARSPQFLISQDGYQSNPYMPFEDEEQAARALFQHTTDIGGYDVAYVGDGYVLCADCARQAFLDPDEPDHDAIHAGEISASVWHADTEHSHGVNCDHCNEYIIEPFCVECWDEADDTMFTHTQYSMQMHARCLAEIVVKGQAHKTGKRAYDVAGHGTYTR